MKSHRSFGALTIALLLSCPWVCQAEDLQFYSDRIRAVTEELETALEPTLDTQAQEVLEEIEFEAPLSWETNAEARRVLGSRRIVKFNAGLLAVSDWLALAMIADWSGHEGCFREYSGYLAELVSHNSRRISKGKELKYVHDFESYAGETRGYCEGALQDAAGAERHRELRQQFLDAAIATVVLHEIAHHVLEHVNRSGGVSSFVQQRMNETAADRWAFDAAVKANYVLRSAVPLFLFLAATGGGTLEDEFRSTHPGGLRRVRDLLVQTRALLDEKDPVSAHVLDASIDDLNRFLR